MPLFNGPLRFRVFGGADEGFVDLPPRFPLPILPRALAAAPKGPLPPPAPMRPVPPEPQPPLVFPALGAFTTRRTQRFGSLTRLGAAVGL